MNVALILDFTEASSVFNLAREGMIGWAFGCQLMSVFLQRLSMGLWRGNFFCYMSHDRIFLTSSVEN